MQFQSNTMSKSQEYFNQYPFELSEFQKNAIEGIVNGNNVLITAHTGSGKSTIGEFSIANAIKNGKRAIYTTPIKALSNQKYNDFKKAGVDVGLLTGDRTIDKNKDLVIATTEILRNMIFSKDQKLTYFYKEI